MKKIGLLLLFVGLYNLSFSFESDLISERPGQALTPNCLNRGNVQVQTGMMYDSYKYLGPVLFDDLSSINSYSNILNNTVLRFGLGEKFEINTSLDYSTTHTYLSAPIVGFKALLVNDEMNSLAVQYNSVIHQFNDDVYSNALKLISTHQLTSKSSVSLNGGMFYTPRIDEFGGDYVISLGINPTKKLGIVLENYGNYAHEFKTYFDAGVGYLIAPLLQVDTYFGLGANEKENTFFVNAGLTYRFDYKGNE